MLKRVFALALCFCMVFLFACEKKPVDSTATVTELLDKVMEKALWENDIHTMNENPIEDYYFTYYYGVEKDAFFSVVQDYALSEQKSSSANEIGIFKIQTEFDEDAFRASSDLTGDALNREIEARRTSFVEDNLASAKAFCENRVNIFLNKSANYDAAEYDKAQNALINSYGYYVYYIVSGDNASFEKTIIAQIDAKAA